MCKICGYFCDAIEKTFGHTVDPRKLCDLIESSPVKEEEKK